jgi:hypothetical protein
MASAVARSYGGQVADKFAAALVFLKANAISGFQRLARLNVIRINPFTKVLVALPLKICPRKKRLNEPIPFHLDRMQDFVVRIFL